MNRMQRITISPDEFQQLLEPLIRRIIQEELFKVTQYNPNIFFLNQEMPLYEDMEEIAKRKAINDLEFVSHDEVWNE